MTSAMNVHSSKTTARFASRARTAIKDRATHTPGSRSRPTIRRSTKFSITSTHSADTAPQSSIHLDSADRKLCISFSAAGLLFPYQVGSATALQDMGILQSDTVMAGCSAGSLVCAFHHSGVPFEVVLGHTKQLYRDLKHNGYAWRIEQLLLDLLMDVLPDDCHLKCSGRMTVALTQFQPPPAVMQGKLIDQWESKRDLVEALVCSTFQPFYSGPKVGRDFRGGKWNCDGALTNFIPPPPDDSYECFNVVPSPWRGADINPGRRGFLKMPYNYPQLVAMVFLPILYSDSTVDHLYQLGYEDAQDWAKSNRPGFDRGGAGDD